MKSEFKEFCFSILLGMGCVSFLSSIIWTFAATGDRWLWFSRMAVGTICAGFLYLGECIKEKE